MVALALILPKYWMRSAACTLAVYTTMLICLLLNYKGYFRQAAFSFLTSFWIIATAMALTAGGLASQATVVYLPLIVAAGVLLGSRWSIGMAILCTFTVLVMVELAMHDMLPARRIIHTPFTLWLAYALCTTLIAVMQYLASRKTDFAFGLLREEITERKKAEVAIHELNESLEKKIAERTAELQETNMALEAFNYSVSHDLQAPMRTVNGYAKILLREYDGQFDDEGKHLLQAIHTNMGRMSQLVRDLLEFSKAGKVALTKESVDMNEIVSAVIDEVKRGQLDINAEIIVHDLNVSVSDSHLIRQVWTNLISNSVKFSGKVNKPLIEIGSQMNNGQSAYYVRDNGVGFDMQYADKLFDPFQRLHSRSEFDGTGIGLATVYRIISRHGGKIWAEAKPDEGATFYFTIPA